MNNMALDGEKIKGLVGHLGFILENSSGRFCGSWMGSELALMIFSEAYSQRQSMVGWFWYWWWPHGYNMWLKVHTWRLSAPTIDKKGNTLKYKTTFISTRSFCIGNLDSWDEGNWFACCPRAAFYIDNRLEFHFDNIPREREEISDVYC